MIELLQTLDSSAFRFGNESLANPAFDWLMPIATGSLPWTAFAVSLLAYAIFARTKRIAVLCLLTLGCVVFSDLAGSYLFKPLFNRPRPCYTLDSVRLLVSSCGGTLGLPSGHATNAMALAVFFAMALRNRWAIVGFLLAALIGFSRVYVGVHFPGDVITGFAIGASLAAIFYFLVRRHLEHPYKSHSSPGKLSNPSAP